MKYKNILESDIILLQIACDYIECNLPEFAKIAMSDNPDWVFDRGEVFLTEALKIYE